MSYPAPVQRLIEQLQKLPTVGPRTAARFALYLTKMPESEFEQLVSALQQLKQNIALCLFCFKPYEKTDNEQQLCEHCSNPERDDSRLCIVEKEADLTSLESTGEYNGLYFILGGALDRLRKENIDDLRIKELKQRITNPAQYGLENTAPEEVIIATNPTGEGEATRLLLERELGEFDIKITRLGRGLPIGGELEYADEETLASALSNRT